jgi:hypothetical protein
MSILYKFRDWEKDFHKNILRKCELFIPSPLALNDPFDCQVTENLNLLDNDEKINEFINIQIKILGLSPITQETKTLKADLFKRLIEERDILQQEIDEFSIDRLDKRTGVLSLSTNWDSILMWGHYANSHKGFCIGFDSEYLDNSGLFNKGGLITYSKDYPKIDPNLDDIIELSFLQTHTKSDFWTYESEYRYNKIFNNSPSDEERIIKIDLNGIREIILGLNFPINDIKEIIEISKKYRIELYQTKKKPYKFELDRIKIAYT